MRTRHLLPAIALTLTLGACGGTENRGVESVHQAVVSRSDYVFDMADAYGPESARRLDGWFDTIKLKYGDRVSIDDPSRNPANRNVVASIANRYGLELEDSAPVTQGAIAPGSFRVVVSRATATVPGCPDWSRTSTGNFNNDMASNYGCATNATIAAMIANKEDLIYGREPAPIGRNKINPRTRVNTGDDK